MSKVPAQHGRNPIDEQAVSRAAAIWRNQYSPDAYGEIETTDDEADIAFEAVLLEQGVLSPTDVVVAFEVSVIPGTTVITLVDGVILLVRRTGRVTVVV